MNRRNLIASTGCLPVLAACGTQPDTTATINRVIAAIGSDGVGVIGAIAILSAAKPDQFPPSLAVKVTASLSGSKSALVALRDGLPNAMKPADAWGMVDASLGLAQSILAALPVIDDARARAALVDAQLGLVLARTIVAGARG